MLLAIFLPLLLALPPGIVSREITMPETHIYCCEKEKGNGDTGRPNKDRGHSDRGGSGGGHGGGRDRGVVNTEGSVGGGSTRDWTGWRKAGEASGLVELARADGEYTEEELAEIDRLDKLTYQWSWIRQHIISKRALVITTLACKKEAENEIPITDIYGIDLTKKTEVEANKLREQLYTYQASNTMLAMVREIESETREPDTESMRIAYDIAVALADIASSITPGVSWGRDVYEATHGRDLFTGEDLSSFQHSIAIIGVVTAGFASSPQKALSVITRACDKLARTTNYLTNASPRELIKVFENKSISELKKSIAFYKQHNFYEKVDFKFVDYVTAFSKGTTEIDKSTNWEKVFRVYGEGRNPKNHWVTPYLPTDPQKSLALNYPGPYKVKEWNLRPGAHRMKGAVAPKNGQPGGGYQYFIANLEDLVE